MRRRGLHTLVYGRNELPAVDRLIARFLPELHLNELILEINCGFRFKSHPEVAEAESLTLDDCRRLTDLAQRNHIRLIPMINCLGHQSWAEKTGKLLAAHPEFDETPDLPPNNPGIYCRSWCPSHPTLDRFIGELIDELIDAFHADAFHVGMDEVFILGKCSRCKGQPKSKLFAKAVNDLHGHIVGKRKIEMQMWGDRLLDSQATGYSEWEASANDTAPAIDLIPKDILICDWHYGIRNDYPSVKYFQEKGFRVWPAGWDSAENAEKLAGCALRSMSEKMVGYLATTWVGAGKAVAGLAGEPEALKQKSVAGVVAGIRRGARIAWEGKL